jgi:mono/diheme cytochrome c family protein
MKKHMFLGLALIMFAFNANAATVDFETQIQPIFTANCVRCHGGTAGMFLAQGVSYNNLVGVTSQNYSPAIRVKSGDLTNSVMYNKINNTGVYGGVMPKDTGKMSQSNIDLIATWIAQLACCTQMGNDLSIPMSCAGYAGKEYSFDMSYTGNSNSADPTGFYWKMNLNSLKQK